MSEAGRAAATQTTAQEKLAGSGLNLSKVLVAAATAYAALRSAMALVEEYRAQEQAVAKLDTTIASLGRNTAGLSARLQLLASQLQRDGVIGDEAIIEGASFLAMYSKITDDLLPRTIRVMADLAAKTGGDVTTAARAMGMAAEGSTGLLQRQGIIVSETAKKSGDFAQILDDVERAVGGTNQALGNTATGGMTQAKNALGEVNEEVGRLIANMSGKSGLNDAVKDGAGYWQKQAEEMNTAIEAGENWLLVVDKMLIKQLALRGTTAGFVDHVLRVSDTLRVAAEGEQIWKQSEGALAAVNRVRTSVGGITAPQFMASGTASGQSVELINKSTDAIHQYNQQLEEQLSLQKTNAAVSKARWDTEHGDLRYATELEKQRTIALAEQVDAHDAAERAAKKHAAEEKELIDFVMQTSGEVAAKQHNEMLEYDKNLKERVTRLRDEILSETELEEQHYQDSLKLLKLSENEKIEATMSYDDLRSHLEIEHQKNLTKIRDKEDADQLKKQKEQAKARAEMMMEPFKNAIRGIQSSFTDFFESVFHGGVNSFKDLARAIKDIFLRLAAEIASLMVFRPIVASILSSMGGTALASQLGLTGQLTGGGGFSLPGIPGMGNMFSGAGNFINNIGGMLGLGVPQAAVSATGIAGMAGTEGITQFFASAAGGNVAGMAPGAFSGASLTGVLGAGAMGYMGGGMFADMLGLNSQNGSIGGAIGASIGMMTPLGPVGALIGGALGSALGGLFGNDKDYPFTNAQVLVDKNGVATVGRVQSLDGGDDAAARKLAEAAVAQFNAMVAAQGYKFDKPFAFYVGSNTQRSGSDHLGTGFYAGSYGGFEGGASTTGLQSPEEAVNAAVQYALGQGKVTGPQKQFREMLDRMLNPLTAAESITEQFDALRDQAKELGLGKKVMGKIDLAEEQAQEQQQTQFTKGLKNMLEVMKSGFPALTQLRQQFLALREQAKELGVGLDLVKKAYREQLKDLRDSLKDQIRGVLDQAYQALNVSGLSSFRDSLSFSALAPGSPIDRFNTARDLLNQTATNALAGDNAAAQLFPQLAQELLTLGRDVYASGPQYAELFTQVNTTLNEVISNQQTIYEDLASSVSVTIQQTSQDQIAVLRDELGKLNDTLLDVKAELRKTRAA
jgi:hypothetical protein